jgi:hypothetical protein
MNAILFSVHTGRASHYAFSAILDKSKRRWVTDQEVFVGHCVLHFSVAWIYVIILIEFFYNLLKNNERPKTERESKKERWKVKRESHQKRGGWRLYSLHCYIRVREVWGKSRVAQPRLESYRCLLYNKTFPDLYSAIIVEHATHQHSQTQHSNRGAMSPDL